MNEQFNISELIKSVQELAGERDKYTQLLADLADPETSPLLQASVIFGRLETLAETAGLDKSANFAELKERISEEHSRLQQIKDKIREYNQSFGELEGGDKPLYLFPALTPPDTSPAEVIEGIYSLLHSYVTRSLNLWKTIQQVNNDLQKEDQQRLSTFEDMFQSASSLCWRLIAAYRTIESAKRHEAALKSVLKCPEGVSLEKFLGLGEREVSAEELNAAVQVKLEELYAPIVKSSPPPLWKRLVQVSAALLAGAGICYFVEHHLIVQPHITRVAEWEERPERRPRECSSKEKMERLTLLWSDFETHYEQISAMLARSSQRVSALLSVTPKAEVHPREIKITEPPKPTLETRFDCPDSITVGKNIPKFAECKFKVSYAQKAKTLCKFSCSGKEITPGEYKSGSDYPIPIRSICRSAPNPLEISVACQYRDQTWSEPEKEIVQITPENVPLPAKKIEKSPPTKLNVTPQASKDSGRQDSTCGYEIVVDGFTKPSGWSGFVCVPPLKLEDVYKNFPGCYKLNEYSSKTIFQKYNLNRCGYFCCSPEARKKYFPQGN